MILASARGSTTEKTLPSNWRSVALGEVCTAIRGVTFPSGEMLLEASENSVACLTTSGVQDVVAWGSRRFIPKVYIASDEQMLRLGDILVSTANSKALVGKSCVVRDLTFPCTFGTFVTVLRPKSDISPEFLAAWMRSPDARAHFYGASSNTTNISNLRVGDLLALQISLPPVAEQKRIAAILTKMMAAVDKARAAAEAQLEATQLILASELRVVFDSPRSRSWPCKPLSEIADTCSGTTPSRARADYYGGDIPWIKTAELRDGVISKAEEHVTVSALEETSLKLLPKGTLLIAMYGQGQTRGRTGLLEIPATINQACFAILPNSDRFRTEFVQWWFRHNYARLRRDTEGRGGGQPNLNGQVLREQKVPTPSLEEQDQIVRQLQMRSALISPVEENLLAQIEGITALPACVLNQAFRGEI